MEGQVPVPDYVPKQAATSVPEKPNSFGDVLKSARETGAQKRGEGWLGKAIKASRERIRATQDTIRGLKDPNVQRALKTYSEMKIADARDALNGKYADIRDKVDERREAVVGNVRNKLSEIRDGWNNKKQEWTERAQRFGERTVSYYNRAHNKVNSELRANKRELVAKWNDVVAKSGEAVRDAKIGLVVWLGESAGKNHEGTSVRREKASQLRNEAQNIRAGSVSVQ